MNKIYEANKELMRTDLPDFKPGDTISVGLKVTEGSRTRIQLFEGVVIAISSGGGINKTFTIRKISNGIGVERIIPCHSPKIDSLEILKKGKVRRAKLYYLRELSGKAARIKEEPSN